MWLLYMHIFYVFFASISTRTFLNKYLAYMLKSINYSIQNSYTKYNWKKLFTYLPIYYYLIRVNKQPSSSNNTAAYVVTVQICPWIENVPMTIPNSIHLSICTTCVIFPHPDQQLTQPFRPHCLLDDRILKCIRW